MYFEQRQSEQTAGRPRCAALQRSEAPRRAPARAGARPSAFEPWAAPRGCSFPRHVHRGVLKSVHPAPPLDRPVLAVRAPTGGPSPASPPGAPTKAMGAVPRRLNWLLTSRQRCPSRSCYLRRRPASPRPTALPTSAMEGRHGEHRALPAVFPN
jgi:hypothetical protein